MLVIAGTIVSGFIGYLWPGPFTGLMLPVSATMWWLLYRSIRHYDEQNLT